jgi:hypothetical protein
MAGRAGAKQRISFNQQDGSAAEAWTWILETERLIEEIKAAPSDPGIDWVRRMLEKTVERKRRLLGLFGGRLH